MRVLRSANKIFQVLYHFILKSGYLMFFIILIQTDDKNSENNLLLSFHSISIDIKLVRIFYNTSSQIYNLSIIVISEMVFIFVPLYFHLYII